MAISEYYVDPAVAPGGAGTIGSPWGSTQEALDSITGETGHVRVNIRDTAVDVTAAKLDYTLFDANNTNGSLSAYLMFFGYTAAENDGGVGRISGGTTHAIFPSRDFAVWHALEFFDFGATPAGAVTVGDLSVAYECTIRGNDFPFEGIEVLSGGMIYNSFITNCGGIRMGGSSILNCLVDVRGSGIDYAVTASGGSRASVSRCAFACDGATGGIRTLSGSLYFHNSIWSDGGTGIGIQQQNAARTPHVIANNVIAGFSGAGGTAIDVSVADIITGILANSYHDCETGIVIPPAFPEHVLDIALNEEIPLGTPPFTDPANLNFAPNDVGLLKEGSYPPFLPGPFSSP